MTLPSLTLFGVAQTGLAAATSLGMILAPERWRSLEIWAYGGVRRPWQFWVLAGALLALWALGLADFAHRPEQTRNWAGWALIVGVPILWAVKAAALVFNPKRRVAVSSVSDPATWRRVGLARLPIVLILALLTWLA